MWMIFVVCYFVVGYCFGLGWEYFRLKEARECHRCSIYNNGVAYKTCAYMHSNTALSSVWIPAWPVLAAWLAFRGLFFVGKKVSPASAVPVIEKKLTRQKVVLVEGNDETDD